jgi:Tol biopolymer transport system component
MRWLAVPLLALIACSATNSVHGAGRDWDAPPVQWVSDLGHLDKRHTYNRLSAVSDNGRWVVFTSTVLDRDSRLFLMDTKHNRVRQLDDAYDGGRRTDPGIPRYTVARYGGEPQITPDGRYVAFISHFSNLVRRDDNEAVDAFVYDRVARKTRIVSRSGNGELADGDSGHPSISADGRFVVFDTRAKNLSPDDPDRKNDIYLKDLQSGDLELISVGPNGKGDRLSRHADISDDGDRISFWSTASNLVGDDTNGLGDVFVRERSTSTTMRVSVTTEGEQYETFESCESASCYRAGVGVPTISGNGEVVVFEGNANMLVPDDENFNDDIFAHTIATDVTERVSVRSDEGDAYGPESVECGKDPVCAQFTPTHTASVTADGNLVYFLSAAPLISDEDDDEEGRGNGQQVFVRDRAAGETYLVSRYRNGEPVHSSNWTPGVISSNGLWVTYTNDSIKLDGPRGDQDPNGDVFLQRLPEGIS